MSFFFQNIFLKIFKNTQKYIKNADVLTLKYVDENIKETLMPFTALRDTDIMLAKIV